VFCHPFAEEKLWTHRVFVSYARRLAAAGFTVLRFDFLGTGDSDGAFADSNLETCRADVGAAIGEVKRLSESAPVNLLGLRFGASVAALVADDHPDLRSLVMWAPIVDGNRYMQDLLRINIMTQMASYREVRQDRPALVASLEQGHTVNVDGYEMSPSMYAGASTLDLAQGRAFRGPCLIVHVDPRSAPGDDLQRLAAAYPGSTMTTAAEDAFWKEIPRFYQGAPELFRVTDEWLAERSKQ